MEQVEQRRFDVLTSLRFSEDEVDLAHFISAGSVVSRNSPDYHLTKEQCYKFALVLAHLLLGDRQPDGLKGVGGTLKLFGFNHTIVPRSAILADVQALRDKYLAHNVNLRLSKPTWVCAREAEEAIERARAAEADAARWKAEAEAYKRRAQDMEEQFFRLERSNAPDARV